MTYKKRVNSSFWWAFWTANLLMLALTYQQTWTRVCFCSFTFKFVQAVTLNDFYITNLSSGESLGPIYRAEKISFIWRQSYCKKTAWVTLIKGKHYFSSVVRIGLIAHFFFFNGAENLKCNPIYQFSKSIWNIKYSFFSCVPSHTEKQNI